MKPIVRRHLSFSNPEEIARWLHPAGSEARARFGDETTAEVVGGKDLLVRCPRCDAPTTLVFGAFDGRRGGRLGCRCGQVTRLETTYFWAGRLRAKDVDTGRDILISAEPDEDGDAVHLPLYLRVPCAGHELWAFNAKHLAALEEWIGAALRERTPDHNKSFASRLPRWMVLAKNRPHVLRALARLRGMLSDG